MQVRDDVLVVRPGSVGLQASTTTTMETSYLENGAARSPAGAVLLRSFAATSLDLARPHACALPAVGCPDAVHRGDLARPRPTSLDLTPARSPLSAVPMRSIAATSLDLTPARSPLSAVSMWSVAATSLDLTPARSPLSPSRPGPAPQRQPRSAA